MNQQQFDAFKAEMRQMIQTRIERPIDEIHQRLGHIEQAQREMDAKMDGLDSRMGLIEDRLEQQSGFFTTIKSKLDHIEKDHGNRLARIESKQDTLEGHFKKVLDGQRKMLEILERLDDKPTHTTGRPE